MPKNVKTSVKANTKTLAKIAMLPSPPRGSGAQKIYAHLRRDILCLALKPSQLLDESALGQQFGMSRSPVREALIRLASEGLVVTLPNKSALVAPLNIEEYPAYRDALDLIQRVTARLAAKQRTQADILHIHTCQAAFERALAAGDKPGLIDTNREFHLAISKAGKNSYFDFLHVRLLDDGLRVLHLYFRSFGDRIPDEIGYDHHLIIRAIEEQNADAAEKHAREHVTRVGKRFLRYLSTRHAQDMNLAPPE